MPIEGFKPYISKQARSMHQPSDISQWSRWTERSNIYIYTHLELQTTTFLHVLWLFQVDDSKSLHKKWLFHHFHPFKTALFRVPGAFPTILKVTSMFGIQVKFPVCVCVFILFLEPVCPLFWGLNYPKDGSFGFQVVKYQTQFTPDLESELHPGLFSVLLSGVSPSPEINSRVRDTNLHPISFKHWIDNSTL